MLDSQLEAFDVFRLHDSEEDCNVRRLIRVYSVLPRFGKITSGPAAEQAIVVTNFLRGVNEKLKKEVSPSWKKTWLDYTGYNFSQNSLKDWFIGRASVPLIALQKLSHFGLSEEVNKILVRCDYFSTSTKKPYRLPHFVTPDIAYLTGAILGDGHIRKSEDKISFEVSEKWLAKKFVYKVKNVFEHSLPLSTRLDRGELRYLPIFSEKSAKRLFTKIIGIPSGKKSGIITIPELIRKSPKGCQIAFLEGVFDTDGGRRGKTFGLSSASKEFRDGLVDLLAIHGIKAYKDEWVNKLYNRPYYGFKISKASKLPFDAGVP